MPKNKAKKESGKATLASVRKEMAKPRMAKSARKKYVKLASKVKRSPISVVLTNARGALPAGPSFNSTITN